VSGTSTRDRGGAKEEDEVADSRRRGEDLEQLDEVFTDQAVDDDDDVMDFDDDDSPVKTAAKPAVKRPSRKPVKVGEDRRDNLFARLGRFIREVVAELRKVIWPTRSELLRYAFVVLLFVAIMMTIVALLDVVFAKGVLWTFGNGNK
jgi:preprotein translocase subunit SecE